MTDMTRKTEEDIKLSQMYSLRLSVSLVTVFRRNLLFSQNQLLYLKNFSLSTEITFQ